MTTPNEETPRMAVRGESRKETTPMETQVHRLSEVDSAQERYFLLRAFEDARLAPTNDEARRIIGTPQIVTNGDTARTRKSDPIESHEAADRSQSNLTAVRRAVLELLSIHNELTGSEINDLYSLTAHERGWPKTKTDTPRKRSCDLIADGYLQVVGRRNGERVLALTDAGKEAVS